MAIIYFILEYVVVAETIEGETKKLFKEGNYSREYGS